MQNKRRRHSSAFKVKVALAALREEKTLSEISAEYGIHPNQISSWKKQILERLPEVFSRKAAGKAGATDELVAELYKKIGQLQVENEWLKKNSGCESSSTAFLA